VLQSRRATRLRALFMSLRPSRLVVLALVTLSSCHHKSKARAVGLLFFSHCVIGQPCKSGAQIRTILPKTSAAESRLMRRRSQLLGHMEINSVSPSRARGWLAVIKSVMAEVHSIGKEAQASLLLLLQSASLQTSFGKRLWPTSNSLRFTH
jgi:hypothetical protein